MSIVFLDDGTMWVLTWSLNIKAILMQRMPRSIRIELVGVETNFPPRCARYCKQWVQRDSQTVLEDRLTMEEVFLSKECGQSFMAMDAIISSPGVFISFLVDRFQNRFITVDLSSRDQECVTLRVNLISILKKKKNIQNWRISNLNCLLSSI